MNLPFSSSIGADVAASAPLRWSEIATLILCALGFLVEGYDMQTMALAIPVLAPIWSRPPADFSLAISALNIGAVIGSALLAPFGDRYGRRRAVGVLLLADGIFVAGTATAASVTALVIWRFLAGLALGAAVVNITVLITERFPRNRQALFLTIAYTNLSLGGVLGGFGNALITQTMTWRGIFLLGGFAGILVSGLLYANLSKSSLAAPSAGDNVGADSPGRASVLQLLTRGVRGVTLPLWLIKFLNAIILFVLLGWLPTMLKSIGWSLGDASRGSAYMQTGGIIGGLIISWLLDHGRSTIALLTTFAAMTAVFLLFLVTPSSVLAWSFLLVLGGGFCLAAHYALNALAAMLYPLHMRATGAGWANSMSRIGSIVGSMLGGLFVHWHFSVANTIALLALPATVSFALTLLLHRAQTRGAQPRIRTAA
jgi:AAHS family 4-hydroxybenzoate transporter-like MFS transporter